MTTPTISLTETQVLTALRSVLSGMVDPSVAIIRGQGNLTPEPTGDFIVMTHTFRMRLATNQDLLPGPGVVNPTIQQTLIAERLDIQLDIHGPNSTDNAQIIETLFRDDYACQAFAALSPPVAIQPLYGDDARQVPFINAANQYEDRWVMNVAMQGNFVISTTQQYADTLTVGIKEVDTYYPPGGP